MRDRVRVSGCRDGRAAALNGSVGVVTAHKHASPWYSVYFEDRSESVSIRSTNLTREPTTSSSPPPPPTSSSSSDAVEKTAGSAEMVYRTGTRAQSPGAKGAATSPPAPAPGSEEAVDGFGVAATDAAALVAMPMVLPTRTTLKSTRWHLYAKEQREKIALEDPDMPPMEREREVARRWRELGSAGQIEATDHLLPTTGGGGWRKGAATSADGDEAQTVVVKRSRREVRAPREFPRGSIHTDERMQQGVPAAGPEDVASSRTRTAVPQRRRNNQTQ